MDQLVAWRENGAMLAIYGHRQPLWAAGPDVRESPATCRPSIGQVRETLHELASC